jgi:hypothetical protein
VSDANEAETAPQLQIPWNMVGVESRLAQSHERFLSTFEGSNADQAVDPRQQAMTYFTNQPLHA